MKIVVLDGYALNPGDLSWDAVAESGEFELYDRTPGELILDRASGAEVLLTNKTPLSAETMAQLPNLRYIGVLATGYNVVDVQAATERGIVVTNVPAYGTHAVTQMVFALLFALIRRAQLHSDAVFAGDWTANEDFCFWRTPQSELTDRTMGIVGFGRIGRCTARVADAFGMRVVAADAVQDNPPSLADFAWRDIPELLAESDVVTLHCPLVPETRGLINQKTLGLMKRTAFLINTSRGPVVVEQDLADALNQELIAGAGLDVLSAEPPAADNPLLSAKNCLITPHIAWATLEARSRLMATVVGSLRAFLAGAPINVVS